MIKGEGAKNVVGGPDAADRNIISGNTYAQVMIDSCPGNVVEGNRIGTNATGTAAVSATGSFDNYGVLLQSSSSTVKDNVIANQDDGLEVWGDDNVIQSNRFGTNADGTAAIANNVAIAVEGGDNNQIGGTGPDEGNVISGTAFCAITIGPGDDASEAGFDGPPPSAPSSRATRSARMSAVARPSPTTRGASAWRPSRCHPDRPRSATATVQGLPSTLPPGIPKSALLSSNSTSEFSACTTVT